MIIAFVRPLRLHLGPMNISGGTDGVGEFVLSLKTSLVHRIGCATFGQLPTGT